MRKNIKKIPTRNFINRNRNKLTLFAIIIGFVANLINYYYTGIGSNSFQWVVFLLTLLCIMYLQLFLPMEERDKIVEITDGHFRKDILQTEIQIRDIMAGNKSDPEQNTLDVLSGTSHDPPPGKPVFIVQPMIVVSDSEFEARTNAINNTNIEIEKMKEKQKTLSDGGPTIVPISNYTNHGVPKKYRAMFDDIHQFALSGGHKTLAELKSKILTHGHPFTTHTNGSGLVQFDFTFIKMPLVGWFGVKG